MGDYQHVIESFTLITGKGGAFELTVNDKVIYSKFALGRHAEPGELLDLFERHVGPDVPKFEG
jgi:predicted Rdx family selenoprotein